MKLVIVFLSLVGVSLGRQICYGNLGCFSTLGNILLLPEKPTTVKTKYLLFTRQNRAHADTYDSLQESTWKSLAGNGHFKVSRPTKFITHGFFDSGKTQWLHDMKDALLTKGDYNVFITDWGHGSNPPYTEASANVFLVGAQIAYFVNYLHSHVNLDPGTVHLIGHSLGAQISGNAGQAIPGLARITGLDPADPYFKAVGDKHRLSKDDATFVDVVHTDGEGFDGLSGYGMSMACGDIDFYPNGGANQPGCASDPIAGALSNIFHGHITSVGQAFSCSHHRANLLYIESIKGGSCHFTAHACADWKTYETGVCLGCGSGGCPTLGFDADKSSARGSFYFSTNQKSPFCGHEYYVEVDISSEKESGYGMLFVTLEGSHGTSEELEFTRDNRHYNANDKEKHVIATSKNLGTITGVKVKYHRSKTITGLFNDREIIVHEVLVRDVNTAHAVKFCAHEAHLKTNNAIEFTSHTGC